MNNITNYGNDKLETQIKKEEQQSKKDTQKEEKDQNEDGEG